jgi:hypothetical protein
VAGLTLSYPVAPFDRALLGAVLPKPTRLRDVLGTTVERALAAGVELRGLDGPCGPPLCAFAADPRVTRCEPVPGRVGFRRHLPACARCAVRAACFGVSDAAIELYGESCVQPLGLDPHDREGA